MMLCKRPWDGKTAICMISASAQSDSENPSRTRSSATVQSLPASAPHACSTYYVRSGLRRCTPTISVMVGSMGLCWRRCWRRKQGPIIRRGLLATVMDHPKTAAVFGGFSNCLDAISNPEHDEHEEANEMLGEDFDPEAFSVDVVK